MTTKMNWATLHLGALTLLLGGVGQAGAVVIYGDIAGNIVGSGYELGPGGGINNAIAEGFTMTQSYDLNSVDIILSNFSPATGSNLALSIYSNSGNNPGTDLYDLSTNVTLPVSGKSRSSKLHGDGVVPSQYRHVLLARSLCDQLG